MQVVLGKLRADGTIERESEVLGVPMEVGPGFSPGQHPTMSTYEFVRQHREHGSGGWTHWRDPDVENMDWAEIL